MYIPELSFSDVESSCLCLPTIKAWPTIYRVEVDASEQNVGGLSQLWLVAVPLISTVKPPVTGKCLCIFMGCVRRATPT